MLQHFGNWLPKMNLFNGFKMKGNIALIEQLKMFITRIGWDSKAVINGDIEQTDLVSKDRGGLEEFLERLDGVQGVGIAELTEDDIIRNKIISRILDALYD